MIGKEPSEGTSKGEDHKGCLDWTSIHSTGETSPTVEWRSDLTSGNFRFLPWETESEGSYKSFLDTGIVRESSNGGDVELGNHVGPADQRNRQFL